MRRARLLWLMLAGSACASYAPPIRGLHAGMPGRLRAGQLELVGSIGGNTVPTTGGPHVGYGLTDSLGVEGGANLNLYEGHWATGWAGVRLTRRMPAGHRIHLVGDLELGAGTGVGGSEESASTRWTQQFSYGIYEGAGLGLQWRWLGVYVRARLDAAASTFNPTTLWPSLMGGVEFRPGRRVSLGAGAGYFGYWTAHSQLSGSWFYQAQVGLIFDLAPGAAG